jgi:hypothetical protein
MSIVIIGFIYFRLLLRPFSTPSFILFSPPFSTRPCLTPSWPRVTLFFMAKEASWCSLPLIT